MALGVVWVANAVSCPPVIPMHPVFKKVAGREAVLVAATLPGGIVSSNINPWVLLLLSSKRTLENST